MKITLIYFGYRWTQRRGAFHPIQQHRNAEARGTGEAQADLVDSKGAWHTCGVEGLEI